MNKKRGRRRKKKGKTELDAVIADFIACGRCSFFLAGYRVIHGIEALRRAAEQSDDEWLQLAWDRQTQRLVQDSYGSRLDVSFYYYDGRCPECQRRYVISPEDDEMSMETEDEEPGEQQEAPDPAEPSMLCMELSIN